MKRSTAEDHGCRRAAGCTSACANFNGSTTKAKNPLVPETVQEQTAEIIRCFDAGATIVHSHGAEAVEYLDIPFVAIFGQLEFSIEFANAWSGH